jgi:hypothetical protein
MQLSGQHVGIRKREDMVRRGLSVIFRGTCLVIDMPVATDLFKARCMLHWEPIKLPTCPIALKKNKDKDK